MINSIKYIRGLFWHLNGSMVRLAGIVMLLLIANSYAYAQRPNQITFSVTKDKINATNEELVDITLKIVNNSPQKIDGAVSVDQGTNLELVSKAEIAVSLNAGDSIFVPVKVFINKKASAGKEHAVKLMFRDSKNNLLAQTASVISLSVKRSVNLFSMVSNILIDNNTDSIIVPVRVSNAGNAVQKVTLVSYYPAIVQDNAFHETRELILKPSTDTVITFSKPVNRKMVNSEGFDVNITGLYANSDVIGMAYVRVQSARSDRNYRDRALSDYYDENTITVSSQSMFSPTQSYMIKGRGNLDFEGSKLGYNVDLTTWKSGYSSPMLRSTWLQYQTNNAGIKAGNINKTLDLNLAGRGLSVFLSDTASDNRYEAGYIDGNTNLLGSNYSRAYTAGQSGWATFSHTKKKWALNSFALYSANPSMDSRNMIFGNSFSLTTTKKLRYTGSVNAAHSSEFINSNNNRFGMALSAGVTGIIKNISVNSSNYFSSAYYPGVQKGALSFNERITWIKPASNLWLNFEYHSYEPKTLSPNQFFLPEFGTMRAEAGISGSIKKVNLSVAPAFIKETSNAYQFSGAAADMQSLNSWDLSSTINYPVSDKKYISLNSQTGIYSSSFDQAERFHLRSNLNYKAGMFSINTMLQLGNFYMGEAANSFARNTGSPYIINIIPSVRKNFFRNKLRTEESIAYMNNSYSGGSWYLTGRIEYDINPKTSFYTAVNHNRYNGYGNSIIEMGITKKLQLPKPGSKSNSLELFVYRDFNQNGVFDKGDEPADQYMLYINDDVFLSSPQGNIVYKNLPDGNYRITMPVLKGWYAPEQYIKLDKKIRMEIPLQRTGTLKGAVNYKTNEFSYEINQNLSGITVLATDQKGRKYKTKTNTDGSYIFYIPVGSYSINIATDQLPKEVEVPGNNRQIDISAENIESLNYELKVRERKIETKKFVSPSISKAIVK